MLENLKKTVKHSAIYSLGTISTKLIGIVLLPLYTKNITVSEYGIYGIIEITIMILTQVLTLGQAQSYLRLYEEQEYINKRKSVLFTILIFQATVCLIFTAIGYKLIPWISMHFQNPLLFTIYFRISLSIIVLRIINRTLLNVLRIQEKSLLYASLNIVKFILIMLLNVYFIAIKGIGIRGILYSYLIGDAFLILSLIPIIINQISFKFEFKILKESLLFGIPLIFSALSSMLLNMGDRYVLKLLVDYKEVGIYSLGYKVAGILNVFFIQAFMLGLIPIAYKMYEQKGDKRYYSKMLTYFIFMLFFCGLALSIFSKELIKTFALVSSYWSASNIVPYIVLGYILSGTKFFYNMGLYLKKKTKFIAYNMVGAAVFNIALNFLLIPSMKMYGAALATIISFFVLDIVTYVQAQRFYKIPYENQKLLLMLFISITLYLISNLTNGMVILPRIIIKLLIIFSFPFILYVFKFYEPIELATIKAKWSKLTSSFKK